METLLTIAVILLIILTVLSISVLVFVIKFVRDLQELLVLLRDEADKVTVDLADFRNKLRLRGPLLSLVLGLVTNRGAIKRITRRLLK